MRHTEDDVTNRLVDWIRNEADLDDLAAMYSEHTADQDDPITVVVRGPNGPESEPYVNGRCVFGAMAAAPELLAACKSLVDWVEDEYLSEANEELLGPLFREACAAIAKAEGRGDA